MTLTQLFTLVLMLMGLAVLRFGVPLLVMWLIKMGCCRVLHVNPQ